jgi:hypothetical protein
MTHPTLLLLAGLLLAISIDEFLTMLTYLREGRR